MDNAHDPTTHVAHTLRTLFWRVSQPSPQIIGILFTIVHLIIALAVLGFSVSLIQSYGKMYDPIQWRHNHSQLPFAGCFWKSVLFNNSTLRKIQQSTIRTQGCLYRFAGRCCARPYSRDWYTIRARALLLGRSEYESLACFCWETSEKGGSHICRHTDQKKPRKRKSKMLQDVHHIHYRSQPSCIFMHRHSGIKRL